MQTAFAVYSISKGASEMDTKHVEAQDHEARETQGRDSGVIRIPYLPPASLAGYDVSCDLGLEELLYVQALITEVAA